MDKTSIFLIIMIIVVVLILTVFGIIMLMPNSYVSKNDPLNTMQNNMNTTNTLYEETVKLLENITPQMVDSAIRYFQF